MSMQAVIFDMDGVIIDSEALWRQAQIDALAQWGATASVDECETLTKGKRLDEIAGTWCRYFQLDLDPQRLEAAILQRITGLIATEAEPMHGVHEALRYFREAGYKIALATSSSRQVIAAVLNKLSLWHFLTRSPARMMNHAANRTRRCTSRRCGSSISTPASVW